MSEAFKEMTAAYQQATKRIDVLEKYHQEDIQKIRILEERNKQANKKIVFIENAWNELGKKVEIIGNKNAQLSLEFKDVQKSKAPVLIAPSFNESNFQHLKQQLAQRIGKLEQSFKTEIRDIKDLTTRSKSQLTNEIDDLKRQYTMSLSSSKVPSSGGVEEKILEIERTLNVISVHHSELDLEVQASLASTYNGAFLWHIHDIRRRIRDAKIGRITNIYSPPFYTGRNGYKMCIRAYLNGDGSGEGTHLSIFFVLMKGEYDALLQWPFESKVSLILVDQDHMKHLVQSFKPDPRSSSFQRPKTDMNVASGCPEFTELSTLDNTSYVKDDQLYIKAIVDTSKIFHP